jgi:hypothetical protein
LDALAAPYVLHQPHRDGTEDARSTDRGTTAVLLHHSAALRNHAVRLDQKHVAAPQAYPQNPRQPDGTAHDAVPPHHSNQRP